MFHSDYTFTIYILFAGRDQQERLSDRNNTSRYNKSSISISRTTPVANHLCHIILLHTNSPFLEVLMMSQATAPPPPPPLAHVGNDGRCDQPCTFFSTHNN